MRGLDQFLKKWESSEGSERSNAQHFLLDLCDLIGLGRPGTNATDDFRFEQSAPFQDSRGVHEGRADLVRRGVFVLEAKQFSKKERATPAWNLAMQNALGQAHGYARGQADPPIFVIACDIGHCFEFLACFDGSYHWRPFPASTNRIYLHELKDPKKLAQLTAALKDPASLDPSRRQVEITTDVAAKIATLARALRDAGHAKESVARFLMRCLFTMFAEDVGLFEGKKKIFEQYLRDYWIKNPPSFTVGASTLWATMNTGGSLMTGEKVQRFNGGLFRDHHALPMTKEQLEILLQAAERDWSQVEPAIFGTLLENALGEKERHALGAHFTPRAYVERLVRPTIEEPLRAEWLVVRSEVRKLLGDGNGKSDAKGAVAALKAFHHRLCKIRVLDPACGTGNFLYVAMDLLKQLEEEVLEQIARVAGKDQQLGERVTRSSARRPRPSRPIAALARRFARDLGGILAAAIAEEVQRLRDGRRAERRSRLAPPPPPEPPTLPGRRPREGWALAAPEPLLARREVARLLGCSIQRVDTLIASGRLPTRRDRGKRVVRWDDVLALEGLARCGSVRDRWPHDPPPRPDDLYERKREVEVLDTALALLPERRRAALDLWLDGKTLEQSAAALGVTRERVRQMEHRAFRDLSECRFLVRHGGRSLGGSVRAFTVRRFGITTDDDSRRRAAVAVARAILRVGTHLGAFTDLPYYAVWSVEQRIETHPDAVAGLRGLAAEVEAVLPEGDPVRPAQRSRERDPLVPARARALARDVRIVAPPRAGRRRDDGLLLANVLRDPSATPG
jgi:DNA-directed RNA polymerase specialized sigma24 family protein